MSTDTAPTQLHKLPEGTLFVIADIGYDDTVYVTSGRIDGMYVPVNAVKDPESPQYLKLWTPTRPPLAEEAA